MANINAGHFAIECALVDSGELVNELFEMYEPLAAGRGITLAREGDVRGAVLNADRNRLMQAFGNLVGNALKFCKSGDRVTVEATREPDRVRVAVSDTGPGIRGDDVPHLFKPFWSRRVQTHRKATGGMGMGLYITKAIVEAHDGTISVENLETGGARFTVFLPLDATASLAH